MTQFVEAKSPFKIFYRISIALNELLPVAIFHAFMMVRKDKDKHEHYESIDAEQPDDADEKLNSDLLNSTSEILVAFSKASDSLDSFQSYLKNPSQETFKNLKLLFDRGKKAYKEFVTAEADNTGLCCLFNILPSLKMKKAPQDGQNENEESDEFDQDGLKHGNIKLENDVGPYIEQPSGSKKSLYLNLKYDEVSGNAAEGTGLRNRAGEPDMLHGNLMQDQEHDSCKDDSQEDFLFMLQPEMNQIKELRKKICLLKEQLASLKLKNHQYEESLFELEKLSVEENAKRNEERKSELFSKIYHSSSSGTKPSLASTSNDRAKNERLDYPKNEQKTFSPSDPSTIETTTASANPSVKNAPPVHSAAFNEQSVKKTEEIVQGSVSLKLSEENPTPPTESFTSTSNADGGRGGNGFGDVIATSSNSGPTSQQTCEVLSFSVQQHDSGMENISLDSKPPVSVATTLYNNYKLLLLTLAQRLLASDVVMLKDWAAQNFSIENPQNATDVLFQLDEKRVINASDLNRLSDFFESIIRFDLVYVIDAFLRGDYDLLRQTPASKKQTANGAQNSRHATTSRILNPGQFSIHPNPSKGHLQASGYINSTMKPGNNGGGRNTASPQSQQATSLNPLNPSIPKPRFANEFSSITSEQPILKHVASGFVSHVGAADGPVTRETRAMTASPSPKPSTRNNAPNSQSVGSNGSKHSKFQRTDNEPTNVFNFQSRGGPRNQTPDRDDNWLCSHYKRHCYVKFDCCDKFWPCHRCHNNQSTCGRKKLKSRDTKMLKCVYCDKVQQFGEHCCNCGARFAQYYCGMCKHLTGTDDHPYHCGKCGICRIHGDRSFHCDVCGVCLDVQLRGNHKCREGSAHDECCICLEDAFTGCQILPCSHKVHKECATQMIRSGITRCPICRESFAHKLERRPFPNSRKRAGK